MILNQYVFHNDYDFFISVPKKSEKAAKINLVWEALLKMSLLPRVDNRTEKNAKLIFHSHSSRPKVYKDFLIPFKSDLAITFVLISMNVNITLIKLLIKNQVEKYSIVKI